MGKRHRPARAKRGFTVLELIVFLAVAVILAAYLFPVFSTARQSARRQNCQGNLKRVARAMQAYLNDNDRVYPPLRGNGVPASAAYGWAGALQPQLRDRMLLQCPTEPIPATRATNGRDFTDYFMNTRLDRLRAARLGHPDHTVVDGDHTPGDATNQTDGGTLRGANATLSANSVIHLEAANYAFADGHVAWLRPLKIKGSGTLADEATATFGT